MKYIYTILFFCFLYTKTGYCEVIDPRPSLTHFSGSILSTGCSINVADLHQTVNMSELPVKDVIKNTSPAARKSFFIRIINCIPYSVSKGSSLYDPRIKIKFDGARGNLSQYFRIYGDAKGVSLMLRNDEHQIIYPGRYQNVIYKKKNNEQILEFFLELVANGEDIIPGKYFSYLYFTIDHE